MSIALFRLVPFYFIFTSNFNALIFSGTVVYWRKIFRSQNFSVNMFLSEDTNSFQSEIWIYLKMFFTCYVFLSCLSTPSLINLLVNYEIVRFEKQTESFMTTNAIEIFRSISIVWNFQSFHNALLEIWVLSKQFIKWSCGNALQSSCLLQE